MSIYIERVRIHNFRSLRQVEITLSQNVTLLVGANNAGKTTFLRALNIALNTERHFINQDDLFIDKDGNVLDENNQFIWIDIKILSKSDDGNFDDLWLSEFGQDIKTDANGKQFFAFRTYIEFSSKKYQLKRYVISDWDANVSDESSEVSANLSGIPFHFIDAQRDLNEDVHQRTSNFGNLTSKIEYDQAQCQELENALAELNKNAVANSLVLSHLRDSLAELNRTVQERGRGVEITPFSKKVRDLHKGMKVHFQDGGSDTFSLEYHGMGTRSWASLLAFKAKVSWETLEKKEENEPFFPVLGLEEPEAHLHPNAQRHVYRQLSEIKGQKIISTHSPYIAALADLSEIRHFFKRDDTTLVSAIKLSGDREEKRKIQREVFNTRGELLFAKVVVLCEGETDEQVLPIFAEKYWNVPPFEKGIIFIGCGGSNYKAFLATLKSLSINWYIFSDYDRKNIKQNIDNLGRTLNIDNIQSSPNFCLLGKPIEEYLYDADYINELKEAVIDYEKPVFYENENHRVAQETRWRRGAEVLRNEQDKNKVLEKMKKHKAKLAPLYAEKISAINGTLNIPPKIRELFNSIHTTIFPTQEQETEQNTDDDAI